MKEFRVKGLDDDFPVVILRFPPSFPLKDLSNGAKTL